MRKTTLFPAMAILASSLTLPFQAAAHDSMLDDRWEISGSYFSPDISMGGKARLSASDGTEVLGINEQERGKSGSDGVQLEATWRPSPRQRIVAGWYGVGRDRNFDLSRGGTYTVEGMDPVDYSIDGQARLDTQFELYRLSYGYDLVQTPKATITALAGVYGARLKVDARTQGTATVDGNTVDLAASERFDETRHAPGLGLAGAYRPADRWEVRVAAQGFKTNWGDFSTDGHFLHANAQVGYQMSRHWTAFVGYDWFDLELKDNLDFSTTQDGTTYSVNGPASARIKVHGPTIGVRASF